MKFPSIKGKSLTAKDLAIIVLAFLTVGALVLNFISYSAKGEIEKNYELLEQTKTPEGLEATITRLTEENAALRLQIDSSSYRNITAAEAAANAFFQAYYSYDNQDGHPLTKINGLVSEDVIGFLHGGDEFDPEYYDPSSDIHYISNIKNLQIFVNPTNETTVVCIALIENDLILFPGEHGEQTHHYTYLFVGEIGAPEGNWIVTKINRLDRIYIDNP